MERKSGTTQRKPMAVEGQAPFAWERLRTEHNRVTFRQLVPLVSPEVQGLVLDNFYRKHWRISKIKRVLNLRYEVVEHILRQVYGEVGPPSGGATVRNVTRRAA